MTKLVYYKLNEYSSAKFEMGFPLAIVHWFDFGFYKVPLIARIQGQVLDVQVWEGPIDIKAADAQVIERNPGLKMNAGTPLILIQSEDPDWDFYPR